MRIALFLKSEIFEGDPLSNSLEALCVPNTSFPSKALHKNELRVDANFRQGDEISAVRTLIQRFVEFQTVLDLWTTGFRG